MKKSGSAKPHREIEPIGNKKRGLGRLWRIGAQCKVERLTQEDYYLAQCMA